MPLTTPPTLAAPLYARDKVTGETYAVKVAPAPMALNDLLDVDTTAPPPADNQVLVFDAASGTWKPEAPPTIGASSVANVGPNEAYSIAALTYNRGVTFSLAVAQVSGGSCQIVSGMALVREEAGIGYIGHLWLDQQGSIVAELLSRIGIARDGSDQAPFVLYVRSSGARTLNVDVVAQQGSTNVARALAYCIPTSGIVDVELGTTTALDMESLRSELDTLRKEVNRLKGKGSAKG